MDLVRIKEKEKEKHEKKIQLTESDFVKKKKKRRIVLAFICLPFFPLRHNPPES